MATFTINNVAYQSRPFTGETQVLLAKRLSPTFLKLGSIGPDLIDVLPKIVGTDKPLEALADAADVLQPIAVELSRLSDEDTSFILNACLDVTERQVANGVGWVKVRQAGVVQDPSDKTFRNLMLIAWHVLGDNFAEIGSLIGLNVKKAA